MSDTRNEKSPDPTVQMNAVVAGVTDAGFVLRLEGGKEVEVPVADVTKRARFMAAWKLGTPLIVDLQVTWIAQIAESQGQ